MPAVETKLLEVGLEPGYSGFLDFADRVGLQLEPFQLPVRSSGHLDRRSGRNLTSGQLRRRTLGGSDVRHRGSFTDARAGSLRMLEWAAEEHRAVDDSRAVPHLENPVPKGAQLPGG